jgi:hypothetical protein
MVADSFFYDHGMARYLVKHQKSAKSNYDTAPFDVLLNISATDDRARMIYSSLESSQEDKSNGG